MGATVGVATAAGGTGVAVGGGGDEVVVWLVHADNNTSKTNSTNLYIVVVLAFSEPLVSIFLFISLLPAGGDTFRQLN